MTSGDLYRAKAAAMAARARADTTRGGRAEYARLCLGYLRLADQAEQNPQPILPDTIPAITQKVRTRRLLHRLLEHISVVESGKNGGSDMTQSGSPART